ncbi:MAG: flagellar biosynthesis protein FliQ [Burkholderiaceae bacterium]|nr:flagellar biosynthesis protein FliQ [Burkholderiaceae bacterium]
MNPEAVMTLSYQAMKIALTVAAPALLVVLIVGLVVSIFQAATQINEMTLSFIPKLLALCGILVLTGPWLMGTVVDYLREMIQSIPTLVN